MLTVGFDLDGVGYDFGASVRRYLDSIGRTYGWKDDAEEPHTWNFFEYWNMDRHEFKEICDAGADAGYIFSGPQREGFSEAVGRVAALGHHVVIITDRSFGSSPRISHRATEEWLRQHDVYYDQLIFSADKTVMKTDFFVEDKLENHDALEAAGTRCYLINRPWNLLEDDRRRINSVSEYADAIEAITEHLTMV